MEIPIVNGIFDFEANVNTLQGPYPHPSSLNFSQVSVSGIEKVYHFWNWKWGALILAFIASITTILRKLNFFVIRLRKHPSQQNQHLLDDSSNASDTDSDTDTDTSCSSLSEEEEEEKKATDEEEEEEEEDFRVRGSADQVYIDQQWQNRNMGRRRSIGELFSWSEITSGKSVVKLWDNLNLGLALNVDDDDSTNESATIYDRNSQREIQKFASFIRQKCEIPTLFASSSSSPAMIFSAAENEGGAVALSGWDRRIGSRIPAILAEWRPRLGNIIGVKVGGLEKVYLRERDNVNSALTVGDMRKVNSPLGDLTETDVDTWWDADANIATEERR